MNGLRSFWGSRRWSKDGERRPLARGGAVVSVVFELIWFRLIGERPVSHH
jgi:hypothetical protein